METRKIFIGMVGKLCKLPFYGFQTDVEELVFSFSLETEDITEPNQHFKIKKMGTDWVLKRSYPAKFKKESIWMTIYVTQSVKALTDFLIIEVYQNGNLKNRIFT